MDTKPWYLSKTILGNLFMGLAIVLAAIGINVEDYGFGSDAQADIAAGAVAFVNVVNIILRLVTNKGVTA